MKRFVHWGILLLSAGLVSLPAQDFSGPKAVNGRGTYCRAIGGGEPLVIVHGGPGMAHDYLFKPFSRLAAKRRLVFYDQMGNGLSDAFRENEKVGVADLVEELEGVRRAFGLGAIDLAGQSWGAVVAVHYAAKYPQNVKKLLLLEPAPGSSEFLPAFQQAILDRLDREAKGQLAAIAQDPALRTDAALFVQWMNLRFKAYYFDPAKQDLDKLAYFDGPRVKKFFASSAMFGPYLMAFDLHGMMREITCPVLIVHGDHDVVPTAAVERMAQSLPNAELRIVKDSGHFVHVERPEEYFSAIEAFLARK